MDPFYAALLNNAGAISVGLGVVWMIATGRLVTRRENDNTVHREGEWRTESRIKDQQLQELSDQNDLLLNQIGPTLTKFLTDMRQFADDARRSKDVG